jgi:hypothetical protein
MKKFILDHDVLIISILVILAIVAIVTGSIIDRNKIPVDHAQHEYVLLLTTGEHLTVQFEKCQTEIFWSSMYVVCGTNTVNGTVDETWRAAIVAMEER